METFQQTVERNLERDTGFEPLIVLNTISLGELFTRVLYLLALTFLLAEDAFPTITIDIVGAGLSRIARNVVFCYHSKSLCWSGIPDLNR